MCKNKDFIINVMMNVTLCGLINRTLVYAHLWSKQLLFTSLESGELTIVLGMRKEPPEMKQRKLTRKI